MTHSPIAPKLAAAILSLWFTLATAGSATDQTSPTPSAAYGDYRDYLTFRRFRIDAESHPDPASRESAAASANALAAKVDALDLEKLRDTIRNSNRDRQRILQLLRAMSDQASAQELEAEAQRLQLAREQDQAVGTFSNLS